MAGQLDHRSHKSSSVSGDKKSVDRRAPSNAKKLSMPECGKISGAKCVPGQTETMHGYRVPDQYRPLENLKDPAVIKWYQGQSAKTTSHFESNPTFKANIDRLTELTSVPRYGSPVFSGNLEFYAFRDVGKNQYDIMVRDLSTNEVRTFVDVNGMSADGSVSLTRFALSGDGTKVVYLAGRGNEFSDIRVRDVATGIDIKDPSTGKTLEIKNAMYASVAGSIVWNSDSSGFYFPQNDGTTTGAARKIFFKNVKDGSVSLVWEGRARGEFARPILSSDGRYLAFEATIDQLNWDLFLKDTQQQEAKFVKISGDKAFPSNMRFAADGSAIVYTYEGAPNGRIFKVSSQDPDRKNWIEIVPPRDQIFLKDVYPTKEGMIAQSTKDVKSHLEYFDLNGNSRGEIKLPAGAVVESVSTSRSSNEIFVSWSSLATPTQILKINLETGEREVVRKSEVPVRPGEVVVEQLSFKSLDGVTVPMFLARRADTKLDGNNAVLISAYGAARISLLPRFSEYAARWIELGGVYVIVNARGGNEFGDAWFQAGSKAGKQNTINDVIAAVKHLRTLGYRNKPVVNGNSSGALAALGAGVQASEEIGGVISISGLTNMTSNERVNRDRSMVTEHGSSENPQEFKGLLDMSPIHRVQKGKKYPATFLAAGELDARVHPSHSLSMAAALQDANPKNIVRLFIGKFGHIGSSLQQTNLLNAQALTFAAEVTGLDKSSEKRKK